MAGFIFLSLLMNLLLSCTIFTQCIVSCVGLQLASLFFTKKLHDRCLIGFYRSSHQRCSIKKLFEKFRNIHRKTASLESLVKLQACNVIKKRLQHSCLPAYIVKFLRTPILKNVCEWLRPFLNTPLLYKLFSCLWNILAVSH